MTPGGEPARRAGWCRFAPAAAVPRAGGPVRALVVACIVTLPCCVLPASSAGASEPAATTTAAAFDTLTAMELSNRWRTADSVATALVGALEREPIADSLALAKALVRQASYRRILTRLRDGAAERAVQRAIAIAERLRPRDPRLLCLAHGAATLLYVDLAQGDSALAQAQRGLAVARAMRPVDDSLLAAMYLREGQAHRARLDYTAGIQSLRVARELTSRRLGPDALEVGLICSELGRALTMLGEFDLARLEHECAVRAAERHFAENPQRLEMALSGFATLERRAGNRARAVELLVRAHALCVAREGPGGPQAILYLANLAGALVALGDFPRTRTILESVIEQRAATLAPAHPGLVQDRITLANACTKLGDATAARIQLDRVDSILAASGSRDRVNLAYAAMVRTGLEIREGRYVEARRLLMQAAARGPLELAPQADLLGQLFATLQTPADTPIADSLGGALDALADSTDIERTKNWPFTLWERARAEGRVGRRDAAWAHARASEREGTERFQWEIASLPDRSALLFDEGEASPAEVLVELARPQHPEELREAWDAVVRRRGAVREQVAARRALGAGTDTALAGAHARWVAASRRHAQRVVAGTAESSDPVERGRFESSRQEVEEAERRYARLASASGNGAGAEPLSLDRVLASLEPGHALVAFVGSAIRNGEEHLAAFVARGGGGATSLARLGASATIAGEVRAWTSQLVTPPSAGRRARRTSEAAARSAGEAVRRRVWDPLLAAIGDATEVHLVGAGPLLDLPWLALPAANGRYLAEDARRLRVHASERELLRMRGGSVGGGLLAVGDPDFDGGVEPAGAPGAFAVRVIPGDCARADHKLGPLPGAREEARSVAGLWDRDEAGGSADTLIGGDATEARFKQLAPGRRVIHLATHGILTRDSCARTSIAMRGVGGVADLGAPAAPPPRRPKPGATVAAPVAEPLVSPWLGRDVWLAFAGANRAPHEARDENEGWLTADEVATLDLRGVERVVLSACQSGVADRWTQEAVLGMRRAFHLAGARCVIASQWPIADAATREWMEAFYASDASSAGQALQEASRAVIASRRTRGLGTHPFYWAAFTATGD